MDFIKESHPRYVTLFDFLSWKQVTFTNLIMEDSATGCYFAVHGDEGVIANICDHVCDELECFQSDLEGAFQI